MLLAVEHARKIFRAMTRYGDRAYAVDLIDFRIANRDNLAEQSWMATFWAEVYYGNRSLQEGALRTRDIWDAFDGHVFKQAIVTQGLAGWWRFEENTDVLHDATAFGNDGTYPGQLYRRPGIVGCGLGFDGIDDTVDCGNAPSLHLTNNCTVEAWVKSDQAGTSQGVLGKQAAGGKGGWSLLKKPDNRFSVLVSSTNRSEYVDGIFIHPESEWNHVGFVVADGRTALYVDGVEQLDTGATIPSESGLDLVLGRLYPLYAGLHFSGTMDEVRVYSRPLSLEEINQNFRFRKQGALLQIR